MARHPEGWKLRGDDGEIKSVRFRHQGRRYEITTGERDPGAAGEAGARIYAQIISGRWRPTMIKAPRPGQPIKEVGALWLADVRSTLDPLTAAQYELYLGTHWRPFFVSLDRVTSASAADYTRARLRKVRRNTVRKEQSALRGFLRWCVEQGLLEELPVIAPPPRNVTGTPDTTRVHKAGTVELTRAQVRVFLSKLPKYSDGGPWKKRPWPVRAALTFAYETSLRPATIEMLQAPGDYKRGARELVIRDEIDKARFGRSVPLSPAARRAIDSVCPDVGPIFGHHEYRPYIEAACKAAGLPRISPYDLRHARLTHLAETSQNLPGVAFLAGHKNITTTNRYVHPSRQAAEQVLRQAAIGGNTGGKGRARRGSK